MPGVVTTQDIPQAHKIALTEIAEGAPVIRYGVIWDMQSARSIKGTGSMNSCWNFRHRRV